MGAGVENRFALVRSDIRGDGGAGPMVRDGYTRCMKWADDHTGGNAQVNDFGCPREVAATPSILNQKTHVAVPSSEDAASSSSSSRALMYRRAG